MRALWSLPKAVPALLRHIGAYIELGGLDLQRTQRELTGQLVAAALLAICVIFVVLFCCLGVIAYTWDTAYRMAAIAWLAGGFVVVAIIAAIYLSRISKARSPLLSDVKREWREDRVILERILSDEE